MLVRILSCAVVLVLAFSTPTEAQPSSAPDVVLLRGGGMLRGTIASYDPEDAVVITLPTGQVRRVDADEVEWAGPADERPRRRVAQPADELASPTRPTAPIPVRSDTVAHARTVEPPRARAPQGGDVVRFVVDDDIDDLVVHHVEGTDQRIRGWAPAPGPVYAHIVNVPRWGPLCRAPCARRFELGEHGLRLSRPGHGQTRIPSIHVRPGGGTLRITWIDRSDVRIAGGVTLGLGLLTGGAIVFGPPFAGVYAGVETLAVGIGVAGLSLIVGMAMLALGDSIETEYGDE